MLGPTSKRCPCGISAARQDEAVTGRGPVAEKPANRSGLNGENERESLFRLHCPWQVIAFGKFVSCSLHFSRGLQNQSFLPPYQGFYRRLLIFLCSLSVPLCLGLRRRGGVEVVIEPSASPLAGHTPPSPDASCELHSFRYQLALQVQSLVRPQVHSLLPSSAIFLFSLARVPL